MRYALVLLSFAFATLSGAAESDKIPPAQIAVSPSKFVLELGDKPIAESVKLINLGDQPVTIDTRLVNWDLDEANSVRPLAPDEQSLEQWMIVNPLRFEIPAGGTQTVRFLIRPKVRPEPGEHRAMIYFSQVLPESAPQGRFVVKFRLGVAVYAHVGEMTRLGKLNKVEVDAAGSPVRARFDVSSEGSAHVRLSGRYAVYSAEGFPGTDPSTGIETAAKIEMPLPSSVFVAGSLPTTPVLPGARRDIVVNLGRGRLSPGHYVLAVRGDISGESIDSTIPFTVPDPQLRVDIDP